MNKGLFMSSVDIIVTKIQLMREPVKFRVILNLISALVKADFICLAGYMLNENMLI